MKNIFLDSPVKTLSAPRHTTRGVALIFTLLMLTLLMVLSLGMVIALSSQTFIGGYYRNYRGAFYAADSGINVIRQSMINKVTALVPATVAIGAQPLGTGTDSTVQTYVNGLYAGWSSINSGQAAGSWPGQFQVSSSTFTFANCHLSYSSVGTPPAGGPYTCTSLPPAASTCSTAASILTNCYTINNFQYTYTYTIDGFGQVNNSEHAEILDNGNIGITVNISQPSGVSRNQSFAAWGMFIDQSTLCDGSTLVNGTITGPVFTNGAWNFNTGSYIFTDAAGQHGSQAGANFSSCQATSSLPKSSSGQTVNPTFQNGFTFGATAVPLPTNSFSQKWAALDGRGTGEVNSTPTNTDFIASNMRLPSGTLWPASGTTSGVYMPYSTVPVTGCSVAPCMTGGGIYVKGNATVSLSAVTSSGHKQQVFTIVNNSSTTTITVDLTANTTTFTKGASTTVINGVPENFNASPPSEATMLYVDGDITSLSGSGSASVQDGSALTVTANGDISITGNLTYATKPVTTTQNQIPGTPADTLIPGNNNGQVFGIFTATGDVNLHMPSSGQNLEIDASIATISSGGSGGIVNNGNSINQLNIMGGRIQNTIQNIGATTRNVYFDRRFAQGNFAPPWFPATTVTTTPTGVETSTVSNAAAQRVQWTCKSCT